MTCESFDSAVVHNDFDETGDGAKVVWLGGLRRRRPTKNDRNYNHYMLEERMMVSEEDFLPARIPLLFFCHLNNLFGRDATVLFVLFRQGMCRYKSID